MNILVTGAAGFIGSHVTDALLEKGHRVTGVDDLSTGRLDNLKSAELYEVDIADTSAIAEIMSRVRPEVVVHLAAQPSVNVSMRDPLLDARSNVIGLVNVLTSARNAGTRKIVFSTSGGTIYGQAPEDSLPVKENAPQVPESFYGITKKAGVEYLRIFGMEHVSLAFGNVYGPRQDPDGEAGVVGIFASRLLAGESCVVYGDGKTTRDYVYVSDVVDAISRALTRGTGLINIGTGVETSVLDVHGALAGHLGARTAPVHAEPRPGEVRRVCLDPAKALVELGWRPSVSLGEGTAFLLNWLRGNG